MAKNADHAMSQAVLAAYGRGEDDETMLPLVRVEADGTPRGRLTPHDAVIFYEYSGGTGKGN